MTGLSWRGYFLFAWIFSDGENGKNSFDIFLFLLRMKHHSQNSQRMSENPSKHSIDYRKSTGFIFGFILSNVMTKILFR